MAPPSLLAAALLETLPRFVSQSTSCPRWPEHDVLRQRTLHTPAPPRGYQLYASASALRSSSRRSGVDGVYRLSG